jgi:hypothetical protein
VSAAFDPLDYGPIWRAIEGTDMKRVSQMRLYRLGTLTRLREIHIGDPPQRAFLVAANAKTILTIFIQDLENQKTLPRAVERAKNILATIDGAWATLLFATGSVVSRPLVEDLSEQLLAFEASLDDELWRLHTYMADAVAAYSFDRLIGTADTVFPEEYRLNKLIPEQALGDFRSAGRCLAFDLPTACGFHSFRAADAMLRKYYAHFVAGTAPKKKIRDWGSYIRVLRSILNDPAAIRKPNKRTIDLLDSIREIDRNPVVHPELDLDTETALATFDLCKNDDCANGTGY